MQWIAQDKLFLDDVTQQRTGNSTSQLKVGALTNS